MRYRFAPVKTRSSLRVNNLLSRGRNQPTSCGRQLIIKTEEVNEIRFMIEAKSRFRGLCQRRNKRVCSAGDWLRVPPWLRPASSQHPY